MKNVKSAPRAEFTAPDTIERALHERGIFPIAGVDEVGRGPLAGPVVTCAIVLPAGCVIEGVRDSKKVPAARRAVLAEEIKRRALAYAFGMKSPQEIDEINILQAAMQAMADAVLSVQSFLGEPLQYVLVDGNRCPTLPCPAQAVVKGDNHCHLIAAASILAKEERDTMMRALHREYPHYGFDKNMGYGTQAHLRALKEHGFCPAHRLTFRGVK
ncbi:MAG: ribonuclease HII [Defluviitaleaceae bacterium]|nr:ribonuclease HII [Defluviitaleaceae bacterium]MCL2274791.1 ribonuclease HII [Defluviitaleaceae bacterium]